MRSLAKLITGLTLFLSITINSHSAIIFASTADKDIQITPLSTVMCVLFLPICLLDGDVDTSVTEDMLRENLYSAPEITEILAGQLALQNYLVSHGLKIEQVNGETDSETWSIIEGNTNSTYVDFLQSNFN